MSCSFQRILFPTDFSELAVHALDYARGMAEAFSAKLFCLHVADDAQLYWGAAGVEGVPIGPSADELLAIGKKRMEHFAARYLAEIVPPPTTHVCLGRPYDEIVKYASQEGIDLIVLATHGRGAFAQALLGGTADKVVHKAPCPVLTVRGSVSRSAGD